DQLGVALCHLSKREIPSAYRTAEDSRLRIIARGVVFPRIVSAALDQIRQHGRPSVPVLIRLLETLAVVAEQATREEYRPELRRHARMILEEALETVPGKSDRADISRRYSAAMELLGGV